MGTSVFGSYIIPSLGTMLSWQIARPHPFDFGIISMSALFPCGSIQLGYKRRGKYKKLKRVIDLVLG